jgi:hypothetical protein
LLDFDAFSVDAKALRHRLQLANCLTKERRDNTKTKAMSAPGVSRSVQPGYSARAAHSVSW